MNADESGAPQRSERSLLASPGHTLGLTALLLAIAAYGALYQKGAASETGMAAPHGSMVPLYLSLIAGEWGLLRLVVLGIRRRGLTLRDLIGGRWSSAGDVARDAALALGFWALWTVAETFVNQFMGPDAARGVGALLPRGPLEIGLWVALSITAGICEEALFRGYLMRQLEALSGSGVVGLLGQGVIFGISHGYQGARLAITITIYGFAFGLLARWRRNLRPGVLAHAWQDVFSGIFAARG